MATITRTRPLENSVSTDEVPSVPQILLENIPEPLRKEELAPPTDSVQEPTLDSENEALPTEDDQKFQDLHPSISLVQRSCLTTLNNLLSGQSTDWQPIVPDRRHSMPTTPANPNAATGSSTSFTRTSTTSALTTLLSNLRNNDTSQMTEARQDLTNSQMLTELDSRVQGLPLSEDDSTLAKSIVSLLRNFERLSSLDVSSSSSQPQYFPPPPTDNDLVSALRHFQATTSSQALEGFRTPVQQVEAALLWTSIEHELENVATMCKERNNHPGNLPPHYLDHFLDEDGDDELPGYEYSRPSLSLSPEYEKPKLSHLNSSSSQIHSSAAEEKTRLDLEAVALAIDRLYLVAPQLSNQRVELRAGKRAEMERASQVAATDRMAKGKSKASSKQNEVKELETMLELLGKASERTYNDQSFIIDAKDMAKRLEKARVRDEAQRAEFISALAMHSSAGRYHNQDSLPPSSQIRQRDPEAMLTLPEFIKEALPQEIEQRREDDRLLTLPEFVREPVPSRISDGDESDGLPSKEVGTSPASTIGSSRSKDGTYRSRSKSLSSVGFHWLRRSHSTITGHSAPAPTDSTQPPPSMHKQASRSRSSQFLTKPQPTFKTIHVAEAHHPLRHVLVFLQMDGNRKEAGGEVRGEVVRAPEDDRERSGGTHLLIRYGTQMAEPPIRLPAACILGSDDVKVKVMSMGSWFELRVGMEATPRQQQEEEEHLMDGMQLSHIEPSSFICSCCSLPLILFTRGSSSQDSARSSASDRNVSGKIRYRDLPSAHWEELVDSWMCHSSQKLNDLVVQRSKEGFVPGNEEVLVGNSYFLVDEAWVVTNNMSAMEPKETSSNHSFLTHHDTPSRLIRCLCGSVVGRSQEYQPPNGPPTKVYKMLKYTMRPVAPIADPLKIPLSAFLIHDMLEYVQAHATYRFVLVDEEDEKARLLLWLFKPSLHLSYSTRKTYAIPSSGEVHCAKILFKALSPSDAAPAKSDNLSSILAQYPNFPSAEYLYYPMSACLRITGLLKESTTTYPEGMRTMTGLDVGWLRRC